MTVFGGFYKNEGKQEKEKPDIKKEAMEYKWNGVRFLY